MRITKAQAAAGGVITFWLMLAFFLSGGKVRLFTIAAAILLLLSLPSHALANSCTSTIVYMPDGKTMLCTTCGSVTNCI